jgi:uncharacterized membrane protein
MVSTGGLALMVLGVVLTFSGVWAASFYQTEYDNNQCGNILGQASEAIQQLFGSNSIQQQCNNMHSLRDGSTFIMYIGIFMVIGGIAMLAMNNKRQQQYNFRNNNPMW